MTIKKCTTELEQFRQQLYQNFNNRADTLMELVDAICSNPHARSVVEYSLTPCFRRSYSTIFKAINEMEMDDLMTAHLLAPYLPRPKQRPPVFTRASCFGCWERMLRRNHASLPTH